MKLYIKYMVSQRCIMAVKKELEKLGLCHSFVELGMFKTNEGLTTAQHDLLKTKLSKYGLELIENKKIILVEKIKNVIIEMVHYEEEEPKTNYSDFISKKLSYDYTYLSNLFSEVKGITIQQFIINHKIEMVKEYLLYNELNLTQIADKLHYSSVAHLSNQFKKITGQSSSVFKQVKNLCRENLENL